MFLLYDFKHIPENNIYSLHLKYSPKSLITMESNKEQEEQGHVNIRQKKETNIPRKRYTYQSKFKITSSALITY